MPDHLTDRIKELVAAADREHVRVDERLLKRIHELTSPQGGSTRRSTSSNGTAPAAKGETAEAIVAALADKDLKLSPLAQAIGKSNSNTFNATRRLVKKGVVVKSADGYYSLATRNGALQFPAHEPSDPVSVGGSEPEG